MRRLIIRSPGRHDSICNQELEPLSIEQHDGADGIGCAPRLGRASLNPGLVPVARGTFERVDASRRAP